MGGVMEWCSKANHEILNSKHQTGAPPAGWGLRRRNLRVLWFQVSVFPAAASLQTGFPLRSNRFQLLGFFFLTPDTSIRPETLVI